MSFFSRLFNVIKAFFGRFVGRIEEKNPECEVGCTPLHYAAQFGHSNICQLILVNVQEKNPNCFNGFTPLHYAAESGNLEICQLILQRVQEKNPINYYGFTPLHYSLEVLRKRIPEITMVTLLCTLLLKMDTPKYAS